MSGFRRPREYRGLERGQRVLVRPNDAQVKVGTLGIVLGIVPETGAYIVLAGQRRVSLLPHHVQPVADPEADSLGRKRTEATRESFRQAVRDNANWRWDEIERAGERVCTACGVMRPLDQFGTFINPEGRRVWLSRCRECMTRSRMGRNARAMSDS